MLLTEGEYKKMKTAKPITIDHHLAEVAISRLKFNCLINDLTRLKATKGETK